MIHPGVNANRLFVSCGFSEALHVYKTEKSIFVYSTYFVRITESGLERTVVLGKSSFKKRVYSNAAIIIAGDRCFVEARSHAWCLPSNISFHLHKTSWESSIIILPYRQISEGLAHLPKVTQPEGCKGRVQTPGRVCITLGQQSMVLEHTFWGKEGFFRSRGKLAEPGVLLHSP